MQVGWQVFAVSTENETVVCNREWKQTGPTVSAAGEDLALQNGGTGVSFPERRCASYGPDPGKESRIEIVFLDRKRGQRLGGTDLGLSIKQNSEG